MDNHMQVDAISTTSIPIFQRPEGVVAEACFARLAEANGWTIAKSTPAEDRMGWDFSISKFEDRDEIRLKVDVKSIKKINRTDTSFQDKYTWIELSKGSGHQGWLYREATDVFAFETIDEFVLVKRSDLQKFIERTVNRESIVTDKDQALGKVFRRKKYNGSDVEELTLVELRKLKSIAMEIWTKSLRMIYTDPTKCSHMTSSETILHQRALEKIECKSERLRGKREAEIKNLIVPFNYCPKCGERLIEHIQG